MKTTFLRMSAALVALAVSALGAARMPSAQGLPTWTSHGPEGGDVISLAIHPNTPTTLYAGTRFGGVWTSVDRGANWTFGGLGNLDVQSLLIDRVAGTSGGGIFKSTNGATRWSGFSNGLTNKVVCAVAIDPVTPTTVYAGTWGGGVFVLK